MTVIIFILLLSVLVLVHEIGHFVAAKRLGVVAEEFGLGLPPRIRKLFVWRGTEFTLNWLPLGGFVRLRGEDPTSPRCSSGFRGARKTGYFYAQKAWKRTVILLAGVMMNIVLGVAAFTFVYTSLGIPEVGDEVRIEAVAPGSPAAEAGLQAGDVLLELRVVPIGLRIPLGGKNGKLKITDTEGFVEMVNENRGQEVTLVVKSQDRQIRDITIVPRTEEKTPEGEGALGIAISNLEMVHYPAWQMPFRASVVGLEEAVAWGANIVAGLVDMIVRWIIQGQVPTDIAGPVGIAQLTGQIASQGWIPLFQFTGVLSINLAIINFLPIPALDGGRLLFIAIEKIRGRPVNPKKERWAHLVSYLILIGLILLVTIQDIFRLLSS